MSIKTELEALKNKDGMILAEDVVDWARTHPNSDLHHAPEFCGWDEKKSAREHWMAGARRLMAIHLVTKEGKRTFYSLSTDRSRQGGGYRDIDDIVKDKALYDILLADALHELERVQAKYEHIKELEPVWAATASVRRRRGGRRAGDSAAA